MSSRVLLERFIHHTQAYAAYHFLDSEGVPVSIEDRPLRGALGEIPFLEAQTALYLEDVSRLEEARELMNRFRLDPPGVRGAVWRCSHCGESHEPEFGACWQCGSLRP